MNSITSLLINIPILLLLYVITYFTQALSGKRQFYGVSLNSDYFDRNEFKSLDKKFKVLLTVGFVISTLLALVCIYIFKAYELASIVPMLGFCIYQFIIFVYIHKKVKLLKSEIYTTIPDVDVKKTKVLLDTEFINEKSKIIKKYTILNIIPVIFVFIAGIYVLTKYNAMPNTIPTHWGISGAPDAFAEKSLSSVLATVGMMVALGLLINVFTIGSLKSRIKLSTDNVDESKKVNIYFLKRLAITLTLLNACTQGMFVVILIAIAHATGINTVLMMSLTGMLILTSIYLTYLYYKSPIKSKKAVYSVDDNDDSWILGSIYNNPNDPSLFVQKRFGVGWTINVGSTKGKIIFILPFLIVLVALAFL